MSPGETVSLLLGYLGPGSGISAIGSILALVAAIVVALVGFVWFPLKRLLGLRKRRSGQAEPSNATAPDSVARQ